MKDQIGIMFHDAIYCKDFIIKYQYFSPIIFNILILIHIDILINTYIYMYISSYVIFIFS